MNALSTITGSFLLALVVSLILVPVCRMVAFRFGYVAKPRTDRWHRRPTALLGGVAIGVTVLGCAIVLGGVSGQAVLLASTAMMFALGLTDDLLGLKPSTKLVVEITIASVFLFFGYRLGWTESRTLDSWIVTVW